MREMPPTTTSKGSRMRYWVEEKKGRKGCYSKSPWRHSYAELDQAGLKNLTPDFVTCIEDSSVRYFGH